MGTVVSVSHCHIHILTMQQIVLLLTVFVFSSHGANNGAPESNKARNPKLFFVSTSQSTSTLSKLTFCYSTVGTPTVCGKRKRSLLDETFQEDESIQKISHPCPKLIPALMSIKPRTWIERESIYCTGSRRPALQPAPRSQPPAPLSSRPALLLQVFLSANRRAPESRTLNNALSILFIYFFCLFD